MKGSREAFNAYKRRYAQRKPMAARVNGMVYRAIKAGLLVRAPCMICGATDHVHAHHDNYQRPLDVVWLCHRHHRERHRGLPDGIEIGATKIVRVSIYSPSERRARPPRHDPAAPRIPQHGTLHEYRAFKCRCELCRAVKADEKRRYTLRKLARSA